MNLLPYFLKTKTQLHRQLMAGILSKLMSSGSLALHTDNAINSNNNTVVVSVMRRSLCGDITLFPHKNMLHYIMWILINMCSFSISLFIASQFSHRSVVVVVARLFVMWAQLHFFGAIPTSSVNMCNSSSSWRRLWHRYHAHERGKLFFYIEGWFFRLLLINFLIIKKISIYKIFHTLPCRLVKKFCL